MANGDITHVKLLYRNPLGGGQSSSGAAKNTKLLVCGELSATWTDAGISVNAMGLAAFGLETMDFLRMQVISVNAVYPAAEALLAASFDVTNQKIFISSDEGAATAVNPTAGEVCVIRFVAIGDDATTPEL